MAGTPGERYDGQEEYEYLCVNDFIRTLVDARALTAAFEFGLVDYLVKRQPCVRDSLGKHLKIDDRGLQLLLGLLRTNTVVSEVNGGIALTRQFMKALKFRDLLEAKLDFANISARDFIGHFPDLIADPREFMRKASMFKLFSYDRCFTYSPENYENTKRWMRITTALTRHEARICMKFHDFSPYRRMLDIGGNSGEFAVQACGKHPRLWATVFDLPLVCEIGRDHLHHQPGADRVSFVKGNALADPLPEGFDLITFKSVLHDWPKKEAQQFLARAAGSLEHGGTLLIFEREPLETGQASMPYSMIPFLLFAHSFRSSDMYTEHLRELGFPDITVQRIYLETPFYLITAVKKKA